MYEFLIRKLLIIYHAMAFGLLLFWVLLDLALISNDDDRLRAAAAYAMATWSKQAVKSCRDEGW